MRLHGLDLFSGIGGIGVGLKKWVRTVAYCERDRYAQSVLLSRMLSNDIDRAPIWDDISTLKGSMLSRIDIIFGGFPCQDISSAGRGAGLAGERSGLFFEIVRLTKEIKPAFVFLENVPAIRTRGLREVIRAFTEVGYDCRWTCLSASSVGAPHKRERWFLLAHADSELSRNKRKNKVSKNWEMDKRQTITNINGARQFMANSEGLRLEEEWNGSGGVKEEISKSWPHGTGDKSQWSVEPSVGRVVNGLPFRVDRIKCLGNSVVSLQVETAFKKLAGVK